MEHFGILFFFLISLSLDNFFIGISYGMTYLKVPISFSLTLSSAGTLILGISLLLGNFLSSFLPNKVMSSLGFYIFFFFGCYKIGCSIYRKLKGIKKETPLKELSFAYGFFLGITLSFDNSMMGILMGISVYSMSFVLLCSFLLSFLFFVIGDILGRKVVRSNHLDFDWVCGMMFLLLAFFGF